MLIKEKSKNERKVEKWFKENGFEIKLIKQYISKTKYTVIKNGIEDVFILPCEVTDVKLFMNLYGKTFSLLEKLNK